MLVMYAELQYLLDDATDDIKSALFEQFEDSTADLLIDAIEAIAIAKKLA